MKMTIKVGSRLLPKQFHYGKGILSAEASARRSGWLFVVFRELGSVSADEQGP